MNIILHNEVLNKNAFNKIQEKIFNRKCVMYLEAWKRTNTKMLS